MGTEPTGWAFTDPAGNRIHPRAISQTFERIVAKAGVPGIRLLDTLLIKAGVPVKVVSERIGHGNPAFTIDTCQHVLPGRSGDGFKISRLGP